MIMSNPGEQYRKVVLEQALLRKSFPFLNLRIHGLELTCRGRIRPADGCFLYRVELQYSSGVPPAVRIIEPKIESNSQIHMYRDGTLCLYDWRNQPWNDQWHLSETIIPWTAEWLVFYELFLATNKWLGPSATHGPKTTLPWLPEQRKIPGIRRRMERQVSSNPSIAQWIIEAIKQVVYADIPLKAVLKIRFSDNMWGRSSK
jgi:hypothetical protein